MEEVLLSLAREAPYLSILALAVYYMGRALHHDREEDRKERRRLLEALFIMCGEHEQRRRARKEEGEPGK